jgi:hypothetical protein
VVDVTITVDVTRSYWLDCDRRIAIENHRDRQAGREVNAEWFLVNAEPFGSLPGAR